MSGHYEQKLWKTETHKHERGRPDEGKTDELMHREGKRKNTQACCTPASSSATALLRAIAVMSEWEVLLCSVQVTAALCLYNSLRPQNLPPWEPSVYVLCPVISVAARSQSFCAVPAELVAGLETHFWSNPALVVFTLKSSRFLHNLVWFEVTRYINFSP